MPMLFPLLVSALSLAASAPADRVLHDFESGDLRGFAPSGALDWTVTDTSGWGKRTPTGFQGRRFLATGKERHEPNADGALTSEPFLIDRPWLRFLMAGELHPRVRVQLIVDGKPVREAFANNTYDLVPRAFDVRALRGKRARIVIEDRAESKSLLRVDDFRLSHRAVEPLASFDLPHRELSPLARAGEFRLALDGHAAGPGMTTFEHTVMRGKDGRWHMWATVAASERPPAEKRLGTRRVVHATAARLTGPWRYEGVALDAAPDQGEAFVWSPHVVLHAGTYHMFYVGAGRVWEGWRPCAPGEKKAQANIGDCGEQGPYQIFLATSKDGRTWKRQGKLFDDTPFAFDPYVARVGDDWVMYYGASEPAHILGKHAIVYRKSRDLRHWGQRAVALIDPGPTTPWAEHAFVRYPQLIQRGDAYLLLAGPMHNGNLSRYHCQHLHTSGSPFSFDAARSQGRLFVDGGAKVVRDTDGRWYVTTSSMLGLSRGVWIAPLSWNPGQG